MKLTVKEVPYTSVVGGGLMLVDEAGRAAFQVMFIGTTNGITKEQTATLSRQFGAWVREHGLEVL